MKAMVDKREKQLGKKIHGQDRKRALRQHLEQNSKGIL